MSGFTARPISTTAVTRVGPHLVGDGVELHLGHVAAPAVGRVGVAAVGRVVPGDARRRLVLPRDRRAGRAASGTAAGERPPSRSFISSAHAFRRPPTTMQVREATVGPLSGTRAVSGSATSTRSTGIPSASATIWASVVRVPWPISVLPTRMRRPGRRQLERRPRGQHHLAGAGEARAVEEEREADPAVRAAPGPALPVEVGALHRLAQDGEGARVLAEDLAGGHRVARAAGRSARAGARGRGRAPRPRGPSAPRPRTRSAGRRSRGRPRRAACSSSRRGRGRGRSRSGRGRSRGGSPGRARPGSACSRRPPSRRTSMSIAVIAPVARDAGAVADDRRVALGGGGHVLEPVVDELDRPARLQGERAPRGRR